MLLLCLCLRLLMLLLLHVGRPVVEDLRRPEAGSTVPVLVAHRIVVIGQEWSMVEEWIGGLPSRDRIRDAVEVG